MSKDVEVLKAFVFDGLTGLQIERQLNEEELSDRAKIEKEFKAKQAELKSKTIAKESALAKLAELGLTPEEIAAL